MTTIKNIKIKDNDRDDGSIIAADSEKIISCVNKLITVQYRHSYKYICTII